MKQTNSHIAKVTGGVNCASDGKLLRSTEGDRRPKTESLGKGKYLPDTRRLKFGTGGV